MINNNLADKFKTVTLASPSNDANALGVNSATVFYTLTGNPVTNETGVQGLLICTLTTSGNFGSQFYLNQTGMYFRVKSLGTWGAWVAK